MLTLLKRIADKALGIEQAVAPTVNKAISYVQQNNPVRQNIDMLKNVGDVLKGFGGNVASPIEWQGSDQFGSYVGSYKPQNTPQKIGSIGANIARDVVTAQAGGINQSIDQLFQMAGPALATSGISKLFTPKTVTPMSTIIPDPATKLLPAGNRFTMVPPTAGEQAFKDVAVPAVEAATQGPKGVVRRTAEYLFGGKDFKGARGVLANDSPAGKAISDLLTQKENATAQLAGSLKAKLFDPLSKLSDNELASFADVVEGKTQAITEAQAKAAETWKGIAKEIRDTASKNGVNIGNIENYFPRFSKADATVATDSTDIGRNANINFGNFKSRTGAATDYIKNPNVLFDYLNGAADSISRKVHFGEGDKALYDLASKTRNPDQAMSILDSILGKGNQGGVGEKVASTITDIQKRKLNLTSPLTNLTQQLSAIGRTDAPTAVKTYTQMIANPEQTILNAIKANEIDPKVGGALVEKMGSLQKATPGRKWLELIRFGKAEEMNRIFAVNAGKNYAEKLVTQAAGGSEAAVRELGRLGIADFAKVSEQDLINAGRKLSQETQFSSVKGGLPQGWETSGGKVITQFKNFAYKQTGFLKDQVGRIASEATKGNLKPLGTFLASVGIGAEIEGEIINDVRSLVTNKKRNETGLNRYLSNIAAGSSLGLLDNVGALTGKYGESGVVSAVAGPTVGDLVGLGGVIADAGKGIANYDSTKSVADNLDPSMKARRGIAKLVPGLGSGLSNTLVPNSYVDNYIGPNKGLNKQDSQTYDALAKVDGAKAVQFKAENQASAKNDATSNGNIFQNLFGGKRQNFDTVPSDKVGLDNQKKQLDALIKNGADISKVSDSVIVTHLFKGKTYKDGNNGDKSTVLRTLSDYMDNQDLPQETKDKMIKATGVTPNQLDYYRMASTNEIDRLQGIAQYASGDFKDRKDLLIGLGLAKRQVGGKSILSSTILNDLYDQNLISKEEKATLTALKYDPVYNKFYVDRDYKGGNSGMTPSQVKTYVSKINTMYGHIVKSSGKSITTGGVKVPKLNLNFGTIK